MIKFETRKISAIKAKEAVEQLFIKGIGQLDNFENSLKGTTYKSEFLVAIRYIEHFANGYSIGARVKYLKGVRDAVTEYEFRTKHLRIFAIQRPGKKIIIMGGVKKKEDSSDLIKPFRILKKEFLEFLKNEK